MAFSPSRDVEDALWRAVALSLPDHVRTGRALSSAIIERSRRYTSERDAEDWRQPTSNATRAAADAAAHALFFTVADAAKVFVPLTELYARGLSMPADHPLTVLDIGAGAGAMSLGIIDYLYQTDQLVGRQLVIHAVDRDRRTLDIMERAIADLATRFDATISLTIACADISQPWDRDLRADLVVAGSVLNELDPEQRITTVGRMLEHTLPSGAVLLIEPALRATTRDLHQLRDAIIERRMAYVFAPCTTRRPCPMLGQPDDWCHEDRRTDLPPRATRLAAATGLRTHGLKFSYLTLRHDLVDQVSESQTKERIPLRIVAQPERSKGKRECLVCGDAGLVPLRLLRKNRGPDKREIDRSHRGDVIIAPARLVAGGDIERADPITVIGHRDL